MNKENQDFVYVTAYSFPNGYRVESENMYRKLRHAGFNPEWNFAPDETGYQGTQIMLPENEIDMLHQMQRTNPARFGSPPEVREQLQKAKDEMNALIAKDRARRSVLTEEQNQWIETLHYHTQMHGTACLDLNESLSGLTEMHSANAKLLKHLGNDAQLENKLLVIEKQIQDSLQGIANIKGATFSRDGEVSTVNVVFSTPQGEREVPVPLNRSEKALRVDIECTGNAAFIDAGREREIARILREVADSLEEAQTLPDRGKPLFDLNGNKVGAYSMVANTNTSPAPEGAVQLVIRAGDEALEVGGVYEYGRIIRKAALHFEEGDHTFVLHDINGVLVGKAEFHAPTTLEKDGVIDMRVAYYNGRIYIADDGYSGMADGEYRYVVTAGDYEPNYGETGKVWLVNAKGEIAAGYEEPQLVNENQFMALPKDHDKALREVIEGRVSFEEHERAYGDDPEPY